MTADGIRREPARSDAAAGAKHVDVTGRVYRGHLNMDAPAEGTLDGRRPFLNLPVEPARRVRAGGGWSNALRDPDRRGANDTGVVEHLRVIEREFGQRLTAGEQQAVADALSRFWHDDEPPPT